MNITPPHPFASGAASISKMAIDDGTLLSGGYWGELRTFLAVAKNKSLNRAADQLGTSRMTAGREIRRLQDALGAQLIILSKNGAALTRKGEELAQALQRFDQEIHALTTDLRTERNQAAGLVRLSVTEGIGVVFIVPALARMARQYPRICVEMKVPQNYQSLVENQTDLMIGFAPENHGGVTSRRLGTYHLIPVASRDYIQASGMPTSDNLRDHKFVNSEIYSSRAQIWHSWNRLVDQGSTTYCSDSSITYAMIVKVGLGIGLLGSVHVLEPSIVPLDLNCVISLPLYLTALNERLRSKPVRLAFDFIASILDDKRPWLSQKMNLHAEDPVFNRDYAQLFNL